MKQALSKIKYLSLTLAVVLGLFAINHKASADTYFYSCSGGGTVTSTVYLEPGVAPYTFPASHIFVARGIIDSSNCTNIVEVALKVHNNFDADIDLIPTTAIAPSGTVPSNFIPALITFTTPATPCSSPFPGICPFAAYFSTGVNENLPTIIGLSGQATPVQGGTNDTNIACMASVSTTGIGGSITGTYSWSIYDTSNGTVLIQSGTDNCTVNINPATGTGNTYPGIEYPAANPEYRYVTYDSICWDSADFPVDPSIPHC